MFKVHMKRKISNKVLDLLKANNKETRRISIRVVLVSLLLTRNTFTVNSISYFVLEFL